MEMSPGNELECVTNLESAVMLAMSRLSKNRKNSKKISLNSVSCKEIVRFLKANFSWVDGDIDSQVMTALLSGIKTGLVCALVSGKYRLIGPSPKSMITSCTVRPSHGPKCSCLNMLKSFSKSYGQICCVLEDTETAAKKKKGPGKKKASSRSKSPGASPVKSPKTKRHAGSGSCSGPERSGPVRHRQD